MARKLSDFEVLSHFIQTGVNLDKETNVADIRKELIIATKVKPREGEAEIDFQRRLVGAVDKLPDSVWESFSGAAQRWYNEAGGAFDKQKPDEVPELVGSEPRDQEDQVKKTKTTAAPAAKTTKAPVEAKAPAAAKAKVATTKATASAKKPAAAKNGGDRAAKMPDDAKIKLLKDENPHRKGTHLYAVWEKYKDGMTVAAALKAIAPVSGGTSPRANLAWQVKLGLIKVEQPTA